MATQLKNLFENVCNKFKKTEEVKEYPLMVEVREDFSRKDKERAGWTSPSYTKSRVVKLDMNTLADNRCVTMFPYAEETEVYKVLRTHVLNYTREKGGNTIMITSAVPGEGKTLTAINLSFAFAKLFENTVLLVDGDLRQQGIHKRLGFENDRGLIDYLVDNVPISEIITWPGIDKLTLISGGRLMHESTELLGSLRMKELVSEMKKRYADRYVIFDVPPVLSSADALNFAPMVDGILLVVEAGKTSMNDVNKAISLLPREKIIGLVLNRA